MRAVICNLVIDLNLEDLTASLHFGPPNVWSESTL